MNLPVSTEAALTALVLAAGAVGYGIAHMNKDAIPAPPPPVQPPKDGIPGGFDQEPSESVAAKSEEGKSEGKKAKAKAKRGKKAVATTTKPPEPPKAEPAPEPRSEPESVATAPEQQEKGEKKKKKKQKQKSKKVETPTPSAPPLQAQTSVDDTDGSWTQVGPKVDSQTSQTAPSEDSELGDAVREPTQMRPLAERVLPKPRKTKVDDMLAPADAPPTLARVMRVAPRADEKPADGFSWGDYEDVAGDERDDDDEGWGVVKSKNPRKKTTSTTSQSPSSQQSSDVLTKKQRQNQKKREAEKAAKVDAEVERQNALAKHKHELEKEKIKQAYSSGRKESGGMTAKVEGGKLVWE